MSTVEEVYSAGEEEPDFYNKTSNVFLGFVDTAIKEDDEVTGADTFIGGEPYWLAEDSIPSEELLRCDSCKSQSDMKLLLQAYAPIDQALVDDVAQREKYNFSTREYIKYNYERVLYVFHCTKCGRKNGSVKCIRGIKRSNEVDEITEKMNQLDSGKDFQINPFDLKNDTPTSFGGNPFEAGGTSENPFNGNSSNPFSVESKDTTAATEATQQPSQKTLRKLHDQKKDKAFDKTTAFPGYFVYVDEESFKNKMPEHLKLPKNLKIDKTALDLSGEDEESLEKAQVKLDPRTEKLSKFLDDDVFQKFQEIVAYNPGQVLRYELGGKPLLYAKTPKEFEDLIPRPSYNPASKRIFELQLMPKMIMDLEDEVSLTGGMDWGTIMIYTDIENYIPKFDENGVGYVQEAVRVQWEPTKYD